MEIKLLVDYRETKLIDILSKKKIEFITTNLPVGDILITTQDMKYNLCCWERKTISDLNSSISDGRYHEQKARLLQLNCEIKGYIIENAKSTDIFDSKCLGVMTNSMLRDRLFIARTTNIKETAKFIIKHIKNKDKWLPNININNKTDISNSNSNPSESHKKESKTETTNLISLVKKKSHNPQKCYLDTLCLIPCVSEVSANIIINKYPNLLQLIECLKNNPDEIDTLRIVSNGKSRKLNKKIKENLIQYLI
jgi:ERCC4-type nuclease